MLYCTYLNIFVNMMSVQNILPIMFLMVFILSENIKLHNDRIYDGLCIEHLSKELLYFGKFY